MSRSLLRSTLELRTPLTRLPPSLLLPLQARRSLTTTMNTTTTPPPPPQHEIKIGAPITPTATSLTPPLPTQSEPAELESSGPYTAEGVYTGNLYPKLPQVKPALTPESASTISQLLPLLRAQPAHYVTAHIWGRPYLVTQGDSIRLPFKMPGVLPGDVLRLDRASTLGSRDYTLKGADDGYIDERLFVCRATVLGTESEPLRIKVKTKRRQRRNKTVRSKHQYTILRISELVVKGPETVGL
ncbi:hypothetical protein BJ170DRAFT_601489 [Xylariales sp. AK1849]|nr:hypothetical protein BJ170DRAFT_601489 [Xylariales sp. AK1849]